MSSVSSAVGNAAYALFQANQEANRQSAQNAEAARQRLNEVTTQLLENRVRQTQIATEVQKLSGRIDTYA